ncbi:hypothetical protein I3F58_27395 [Streptomyces sp. MUM 203J]|uniref:hypothetical protein n=1 Tax=Streptomyces sp. MUM 203J TaxID=2791990 RepID=UPI001F04911B|nr:hypothetical protein [Streptomyces sp. MUM 203J]MCH0543211.1 hypothetical protein [Streptomyces sp. MUM 203J]
MRLLTSRRVAAAAISVALTFGMAGPALAAAPQPRSPVTTAAAPADDPLSGLLDKMQSLVDSVLGKLEGLTGIEIPPIQLPEPPDVEIPEITLPEPPELPELPEIPEVELPEIPEVELPEIPEVELPEIPEITLPELPEVTVPELPEAPSTPEVPEVPEVPLSELPGLPGVGTSGALDTTAVQDQAWDGTWDESWNVPGS